MLTPVQSLPFQKVVHKVSTLDAQPSNEAGGILVMVTGALLVRLNTLFLHIFVFSRNLRAIY